MAQDVSGILSYAQLGFPQVGTHMDPEGFGHYSAYLPRLLTKLHRSSYFPPQSSILSFQQYGSSLGWMQRLPEKETKLRAAH